jgi:predicted  nucleic acid-binding Zn-ribbon protein
VESRAALAADENTALKNKIKGLKKQNEELELKNIDLISKDAELQKVKSDLESLSKEHRQTCAALEGLRAAKSFPMDDGMTQKLIGENKSLEDRIRTAKRETEAASNKCEQWKDLATVSLVITEYL